MLRRKHKILMVPFNSALKLRTKIRFLNMPDKNIEILSLILQCVVREKKTINHLGFKSKSESDIIINIVLLKFLWVLCSNWNLIIIHIWVTYWNVLCCKKTQSENFKNLWYFFFVWCAKSTYYQNSICIPTSKRYVLKSTKFRSRYVSACSANTAFLKPYEGKQK